MPARHLAHLVVTLAALAVAAGCGDAGDVTARLEPPPAVVSDKEAWSELHFVAHAKSEGGFERAEVRVHAESDVAATGQVRVTLAHGDALADDAARAEDTLPVDIGASTTVPRDAFEGCSGTCDDRFTVVLTAEGLPQGLKLEVPLVLEAELFYGDAASSAKDAVTLELAGDDP